MRERVAVGRRTIGYLEAAGSAIAGTGEPRVAVLLHAFPLNADMWRPQLDAVPPGWRFLAPDLSGFGEAEPPAKPPADVTLDDYAGEVIDLLDALHIETAVIGGLSMGGYLTFAVHRLAARYFSGMLLANTRSQADSDEGRTGRRRMLEVLASEGPEGVATAMLPKLVGDETRRERPEAVDRVRTLLGGASAPGIQAAIHAMMARPDSTHHLREVTCPTLIVTGDEDALIPVDDSRSMERQLLSARLEILPGAGHLSNLERPDDFNRVLTRFLADYL